MQAGCVGWEGVGVSSFLGLLLGALLDQAAHFKLHSTGDSLCTLFGLLALIISLLQMLGEGMSWHPRLM